MNKIDKYIFSEIIKGSLLIFFIFLSISWLLQFARLISLTNLIQVDIITILYLSIFLVPNLITIILPFVIIFGLVVTFIKLHKDKEIISIYSLGLNISSILKPLLYFSGLILSILILFNFYLSPKIYKEYKIKEYEIRNKINFEKITVSNFIEINDSTFLDFKKDNQKFKEVFIKFSENNENMIYAEEALIIQKNNFFIFELINGFKITIMENNEIEKLEFDNYSLKINNNSYEKYLKLMRANNPLVIPRNHKVEEVLKEADHSNLKPINQMVEILSKPYAKHQNILDYQVSPSLVEKYQTFCGT